MEIIQQKLPYRSKLVLPHIRAVSDTVASAIPFFQRVKRIGVSAELGYYSRRKLGVFNQLNFLQLITGILIPVLGLLHKDQLPVSAWTTACLPAFTSLAVLYLNHIRKYEWALLTYFILYPFLTSIVYMHGMNAGVSLHFILYGILSVFFLADIGYMLFTVSLSMISYFVLSVILKNFIYQVELENKFLFLVNQVLAILFIFYGLFLIKKENTEYQLRLIAKNRTLHRKNIEIKNQAELIAEKMQLLKTQKTELTELNTLKNRLFSVISHDLKSPMYALRNLFQNMDRYDLPAEEIKAMVPDVVTDLNYTISLMENLLQWSKWQMEADAVRPAEVELSRMVKEVMQLLRLQAEAKKIRMESHIEKAVYVYADRDMINLVLRNLLSNAIKFTPENGKIAIGVNNAASFAEVYVEDSGMGISKDALEKINENNFYSTKGTASESGTGLGLMLCREFLAKNGGQMQIESVVGKGSTFSFTLPIHN